MKLSYRPRLRKKRDVFITLILLLISFVVYCSRQGEQQVPSSDKRDEIQNEEKSFPDIEMGVVERVVDGDTLIVQTASGRWRVRLIGCDTPETVKKNSPVEPFGPEASSYTNRRINDFQQKVLLVSDGDHFDRYGRRLAMVYLGLDQTFLLNEELIRQGLAKAMLKYHYSQEKKKRFQKALQEAQNQSIGIWSFEKKSPK